MLNFNSPANNIRSFIHAFKRKIAPTVLEIGKRYFVNICVHHHNR